VESDHSQLAFSSFQKCTLAGKDYIMTHLGKTKARKGVCYA
jgi:hypothetical protein